MLEYSNDDDIVEATDEDTHNLNDSDSIVESDNEYYSMEIMAKDFLKAMDNKDYEVMRGLIDMGYVPSGEVFDRKDFNFISLSLIVLSGCKYPVNFISNLITIPNPDFNKKAVIKYLIDDGATFTAQDFYLYNQL